MKTEITAFIIMVFIAGMVAGMAIIMLIEKKDVGATLIGLGALIIYIVVRLKIMKELN